MARPKIRNRDRYPGGKLKPVQPQVGCDWFVLKLQPGAMRRAKPRPADGPGHPEHDPDRKDEAAIERSLRDAGLEVYVPRIRLEVVHHRTHKAVIRSFPLFTGYAFAGAVGTGWADLLGCDGVGYILGTGGNYWRMPEEEINLLRQAEADMVWDDTREARIRRKQEGRTRRETATLRFPPGAEIEISTGAFAGFSGRVESVAGRGIVKALISIFGRLTAVDLAVDNIKRVA